MPPRSNPCPRDYLLQSLLHFLDFVFLERSFVKILDSSDANIHTLAFRTEQADFFLPFSFLRKRRFADVRNLSFFSASSVDSVLNPIPRPPLPSALCRSPPPASPHYSPPSLPAILLALPSPRGSRSRSRRSAPALRFLRSPLATRHSPLPPYHSPALPAPAPQTPSSSATLPDRSIQTASRIPSTSCTKSAARSLPSAPPW